MTNNQTARSLLRLLDQTCEVSGLTFSKLPWAQNRSSQYQHLLFAGIHELIVDIGYLARQGRYFSVPVIFRSVVEYYTDFKLISKDPNHAHSMEASDLTQWVKLLKQSADPSNKYLTSIIESYDVEDLLEKFTSQIQELGRNGHKPMTIFERFKRAELEPEYRTIYNDLSTSAHGNLRHLTSSSAVAKVPGRYTLLSDLTPILDSSIAILLNSFGSLVDGQNDLKRIIDKLESRLSRIRMHYAA